MREREGGGERGNMHGEAAWRKAPGVLCGGKREPIYGVHRRPLVGESQARSWSPWLVLGAILWGFIAKNQQGLLEIGFGDTPTKGLRWSVQGSWRQVAQATMRVSGDKPT